MCKEGRCGRHMADCPDAECPTHSSKRDILFTYGTLRPGEGRTVLVPGYLYDLGRFPGIELCDPSQTDSRVVCEAIEVKSWDRIDAYEGYDPKRPDDSLYIRREIVVDGFGKGFIYEYNQGFAGRQIVESGDWLAYRRERGTDGRNDYARRAIAA